MTKVWVTPTDVDVFTGSRCRSPQYFNHPGNVNFRRIIFATIRTYSTIRTNKEKTGIIRQIIASIFEKGGRFLQFDYTVYRWYDGGLSAAKARVQIALRDAVTPGKVGWVSNEMRLMARQQGCPTGDSSAAASAGPDFVHAGEQPEQITSAIINQEPIGNQMNRDENDPLRNSNTTTTNKVQTEATGGNTLMVITAAATNNLPNTMVPGNTTDPVPEPASSSHLRMQHPPLQQLPTTFLATEKATLWQPHFASMQDPVRLHRGSNHMTDARNGGNGIPGVCPINFTPKQFFPPTDENWIAHGKNRLSLPPALFSPTPGQRRPSPNMLHCWQTNNSMLPRQGASSFNAGTRPAVPNVHGIPFFHKGTFPNARRLAIPSFQAIPFPTARRLTMTTVPMVKQVPILLDLPAASTPFNMPHNRNGNNVRIPECRFNDSPDASLTLLLSKQLREAKEMERRHNLERLASGTLTQHQKAPGYGFSVDGT